MSISPDAVTNNANGKVLAIERIVADRAMPGPEQMQRIAALCDDFRSAVADSTADPFRGAESIVYVRCSRCGARVSNVVRGPHLTVRAWVECPECVERDAERERANAIDPDALAAAQAQIAVALTEGYAGLDVEEEEPLTVSWPLSTIHPQPPGVPSRMRVTVTDADA